MGVAYLSIFFQSSGEEQNTQESLTTELTC